ncbi:thiol:disulfide interchange protein [Bacteroidales bacterium]|nr:thiol:disulfide interchange protein [Bacteroidales bacterium]
MKTRTIATFLLGASLILASCKDTTPAFKVDGTVENKTEGKVYLQAYHNKTFGNIDSCQLQDGHFSFSGSVDLPDLYAIQLEGERERLAFFLENSLITVKIAQERDASQAIGSASNDLFSEAKNAKEEQFDIKNFVATHPASTVAAYVLYRNFSYKLNLEELKANVSLFDSSIYHSQHIEGLKALIVALEKVEIGKSAPDFIQLDSSGSPVSLSSFLGQYVLVDFWASWCPPCRRENPNLVKAFDNFKGKNFTVLGVSLDKDKAAWLKAVADDKLDWTHVSDLKQWDNEAAALYGVRSIPSNVLIDPQGIIIAKNLKDEDLHLKLSELIITN